MSWTVPPSPFVTHVNTTPLETLEECDAVYGPAVPEAYASAYPTAEEGNTWRDPQAALAEKDTEIAAQGNQITELSAEVSSLTDQVAELTTQITAKDAQIADLEQQVADLEEQLANQSGGSQ